MEWIMFLYLLVTCRNLADTLYHECLLIKVQIYIIIMTKFPIRGLLTFMYSCWKIISHIIFYSLCMPFCPLVISMFFSWMVCTSPTPYLLLAQPVNTASMSDSRFYLHLFTFSQLSVKISRKEDVKEVEFWQGYFQKLPKPSQFYMKHTDK